MFRCDAIMCVDSFLKYMRYEKNYSSHTVLSYKNDLEQFSAYLEARTGGEVDLPSADMSLVRGFVSSLMEEGMSARTAGRKLSSLRTFYKYLIKEGRIAVSPVDSVSKPRGGKRLPVFVKQSDMDAILDAPDADGSFCDVRDRLVVSMLYHTGMRRAELIALRDEDVDIVSMTLKVTGKRNKQRIIPFGEELKTEIEEYLRLREETTGVSSCPALFVRENGEPLYPGLVYRVVTRVLGEWTTLSKCSPHVLRHTFASAMLNNGAGLDSVKELLGHDSLASTQVYTHVTFEELKSSYKQAHPRAIKKGGYYGH